MFLEGHRRPRHRNDLDSFIGNVGPIQTCWVEALGWGLGTRVVDFLAPVILDPLEPRSTVRDFSLIGV